MYHKVTPNFPMKQVFGRPKTKSLCKDLLLAYKSDEWVLPTQPFRTLIPSLDSQIETLPHCFEQYPHGKFQISTWERKNSSEESNKTSEARNKTSEE